MSRQATTLARTMLETIILPGPKASLQTIPTPKLLPNQILTKVVYAGTNPKDWKRAENPSLNQRINQGDDLAGIVAAVGSDVKNFRPGDRVAALHQPGSPGGSFAEYAVSYDFATVHVPDGMSLAEASTVPLVYNTAAVALYRVLGLPTPFTPVPAGKQVGLVVYGASTSVGAMALQLARLSNLHPIIAIAGASTSHITPLLDQSKGDVLLDYRAGPDALLAAAKSALSKSGLDKVEFAIDCVSEGATSETVAKILDQTTGQSSIARVLPVPADLSLPHGVKATMTVSTSIFVPAGSTPGSAVGGREFWGGETEFAAAFFRLLERGSERGWLGGLPYEVAEPETQQNEWWNAVETGLRKLKAGEARGKKFIVKIGQEEERN